MKKYIILLSFFFCFQFNDSFAVNSIHANQLEHFETQTQKKSIIKKWISKVYRNNPESKFATYFNKHIASTIFAVLGILFVGIGGTIYLVFNRMFNGESVDSSDEWLVMILLFFIAFILIRVAAIVALICFGAAGVSLLIEFLYQSR